MFRHAGHAFGSTGVTTGATGCLVSERCVDTGIGGKSIIWIG